MPTKTPLSPYRGRFAPSPSGRLHFGSLVTALASYLDARSNQGTWIVRIEDIDPPREEAGAADAILRSLEAHGLHSDEPILYQRHRLDHYEHLIAQLIDKGLAYYCDCNRKRLSELGSIYDGHCRTRGLTQTQTAVRIKLYDAPHVSLDDSRSYTDRLQGNITQNLRTQAGDQVIKRRDGLHGYTLAVIADDIAQGITHIVRGSDLLEVTPRHLAIYDIFNQSGILPNQPPHYAHTPLVIDEQGYKLSKQNRAPVIDNDCASENLIRALTFLHHPPPPEFYGAPPSLLLTWAAAQFSLSAVGANSRRA